MVQVGKNPFWGGRGVRYHAVFTIVVELCYIDVCVEKKKLAGTFNLVDISGSELHPNTCTNG